jgi:predicted DNA-binding transcriptional regulator AlpA
MVETADDVLVDADTVRKMLGGISQTSLWRHVKGGSIPRPIKVGPRLVRWLKAEVLQAISDAAERRDQGRAA